MKKLFVLLGLVVISISGFAQKAEIFQKDGKAIRGYDPVAFFNAGGPAIGDSLISYEWKGAKWLFVSKDNRDLFIADPERFAPKYGGYCAYGTADGHKAPTEINTWTILDGKLYFNYNAKVKELWLKKTDEYILKADKNWEKIKNSE